MSPAIRDGELHVGVGSDGTAGGTAVFVAGAVARLATVSGEVLIDVRVQRLEVVDKAPPYRGPLLCVWNVHHFGISVAAAPRTRRFIHRDMEQVRADPPLTQLLSAGDFDLEATAAGRRSRTDMRIVLFVAWSPSSSRMRPADGMRRRAAPRRSAASS